MIFLVTLCAVLACSASIARVAECEKSRAVEESELLRALKMVNKAHYDYFYELCRRLEILESKENIRIHEEIDNYFEAVLTLIKRMIPRQSDYDYSAFIEQQFEPCVSVLGVAGSEALDYLDKHGRHKASLIYSELAGFLYCNFIVEEQMRVKAMMRKHLAGL